MSTPNYKDSDAGDDEDDMPARREEFCLNCKSEWEMHCGWNCNVVGPVMHHSRLDPDKRFLTQSMADSIKASCNDVSKTETAGTERFPVVNNIVSSESSFDAWKGVRSGECPCGISKIRCQYHS